MEGMLIFAGLFSASLTAFLIESYKTLNPDQGNTTIHLLAQISSQLAASANGTVFNITPPVSFTPSASAVVCNALWFLSLGLSLTCALVATLLEQWARDFIHRSEIRSAPLIRARIFSFLYYGLKRFRMHTVVEIIPLLLHTSLFFFFAGLVAFLVPVNLAMAALTGVILTVVLGAYLFLTLLPLWYCDSPYRTPLSGACWNIVQKTQRHWWHAPRPSWSWSLAQVPRRTPAEDETIIEAISREATEESETRIQRDYRALVWTVRSLSDEAELEPFLEAIPDILDPSSWGTIGLYPYEDHFRGLVSHPEVLLFSRIINFRESAEVQLLSPEAKQRRLTIAYKALWIFADLLLANPGPFPEFPTQFAYGHYVPDTDHEISHLAISTFALLRSGHFRILRPSLEAAQAALTRLQVLDSKEDVDVVRAFFRDNGAALWPYSHEALRDAFDNNGVLRDPIVIPALLKYINHILLTWADKIRLWYIQDAFRLNSLPYRWGSTLALIKSTCRPAVDMTAHDLSSVATASDLGSVAIELVTHQCRKFNSENDEWMDVVFRELTTLLPPQWPPTASISFAFVQYLANRKSERALQLCLSELAPEQVDSIWEGVVYIATTSARPPRPTVVYPLQVLDKEENIRAVWCLASLLSTRTRNSHLNDLVKLTATQPVSVVVSISAILKLQHLLLSTPDYDLNLPVDTSMAQDIDDTLREALKLPLWSRLSQTEATLVIIAEFLEDVACSNVPIYQGTKTMGLITQYWNPYKFTIQETQQLRFANAVIKLFASDFEWCSNLRAPLLSSPLLSVYARPSLNPNWRESDYEGQAWLDHTPAREEIQRTLTTYTEELSSTEGDPSTLTWVRAILAGLTYFHGGS
ncbi:hypothetical protein C8R46DRAFT_961663 [Mycena filopes]|nr:hypothetical protein C8R46DRAFT_961663 [Mycena filopes]